MSKIHWEENSENYWEKKINKENEEEGRKRERKRKKEGKIAITIQLNE